ncbi:MAG: aspartate kinase [Bdellovibrionota bacterium]
MLVVQKYGGSSVGTPEKIKQAASRIATLHKTGKKIVVVVSAMGDTTDELVELASKVSPRPHERELDMLLTAGERISVALLSMALRDQGHEAISFTGSQAGIITDESHTRARILEIRPVRVQEELGRGKIVLVAGFQGVSRTKEITTLGRGGSDTTAVALGVALGADQCEVYTDVPGIFSADPRKLPGAKRYSQLPLDLVFEMGVRGAQVMHPRSIEIARERRFPLYVGLADSDGVQNKERDGTMIIPSNSAIELPRVVAVAAKTDLMELAFKPSDASRILKKLKDSNILVHDLAFDSSTGIRCLLDPKESSFFLDQHKENLQPGPIALASLIGFQMQTQPGLAEQVFQLLLGQGLAPARLTCHPQSITVWFSGENSKTMVTQAVERLHDALVIAPSR